MVLAVAQIGWELARKRPISTMQWMSLFLVACVGGIALITDVPRFVMIKPSLIYTVVGVVMLKPGWMNHYLPPVAIEVVPDVARIFGFYLVRTDVLFSRAKCDRRTEVQRRYHWGNSNSQYASTRQRGGQNYYVRQYYYERQW